jgi:hypothetical protein
MNKLNFVEIEYKEPTNKEIAEEEKYWKTISHFCFYCKSVTKFSRCGNCGKRFCLGHCYEEQDSYEEGGRIYPICYHCIKE